MRSLYIVLNFCIVTRAIQTPTWFHHSMTAHWKSAVCHLSIQSHSESKGWSPTHVRSNASELSDYLRRITVPNPIVPLRCEIFAICGASTLFAWKRDSLFPAGSASRKTPISSWFRHSSPPFLCHSGKLEEPCTIWTTETTHGFRPPSSCSR